MEGVIRNVERGTLRFESANGRAERSVRIPRLNDERAVRVRVRDVKADVCFHLLFHTPRIAYIPQITVA